VFLVKQTGGSDAKPEDKKEEKEEKETKEEAAPAEAK